MGTTGQGGSGFDPTGVPPGSSPVERKEFLMRTPFFGGLDDEQLDRIVSMLSERRFPRGSTIFTEGDCGRSMYVVGSGELVVYRRAPSGHLIRLVRLRAGDFFGETTLIEMQPRPSTVQCETDAVLYEFTNINLYKLYQADMKAYVMVLQNINRELCRRIRKADTRITQLADDDGEVTQIGPATVGDGKPRRP